MRNKRLIVFIQDLKDTTTVLQQLEACIKSCKNVLDSVDTIEQSVEDLDINAAESELNVLSDKVDYITGELPNKQDKLVAGDNIVINGNVISGVVTTYTAGDNITIDDGVINATDTTYTAGNNITITDGVISATDTTYTAGTGIDITSNEISVDNTIATKIELNGKQNTLISGTNIKTVNGISLLGGGNLVTVGAPHYLHRIYAISEDESIKVAFNIITTTDTPWTLGAIPTISETPIDITKSNQSGYFPVSYEWSIITLNNDIHIEDEHGQYLIDFEGLSYINDRVQEI